MGTDWERRGLEPAYRAKRSLIGRSFPRDRPESLRTDRPNVSWSVTWGRDLVDKEGERLARTFHNVGREKLGEARILECQQALNLLEPGSLGAP